MKKSIKNLLAALEKTRSVFWNISPETGKFINLIIQAKKYKTVLEIGTSNGYSGIWIAEALSRTNGHLYTMESHRKERFWLAQKNFKASGLSKFITQILGHAPEAIPLTPKRLDLAFFDATKYEHIEYLKIIAPRIKKGGMIITDNIDSHKTELKPYINHLKTSKNWQSFHFSIGSGLLISLKQ